MSLLTNIVNFSRKILPESFKSVLRRIKLTFLDGYSYKSYSQDGADKILMNYFLKVQDGFYIDIGAHHPERFSMTQVFYKKGWSGINIDAMPGSMKEFCQKRIRDINLEIAIAKEEGELTFYVSNEPALNSLDSSHKTIEIANSKKYSKTFQIVDEIKVKTRKLENVLEDFLPPDRKISFLSVDVEGLDLEVLQSNNWDRFRPQCIVVECLDKTLDKIFYDPLYVYLTHREYSLIAKTLDNLIFEDIKPSP